MDDLSGLDWTASSSKQAAKPTGPTNSNYFPSLRPTPPASGRSTPAAQTGLAKPGTPQQNSATGQAKDSFANLFAGSAPSSNKNLSLAERQRQLQQHKAQTLGAGSLSANDDAWANFGTGASTSTLPSSHSHVLKPVTAGSAIQAPVATRIIQASEKSSESEDDILAAFKADAPVDKSSHFPAPASSSSPARGTPLSAQNAQNSRKGASLLLDDDDDPFGLGMAPVRSSSPAAGGSSGMIQDNEDDDILGDLGRPVSELPARPTPRIASPSSPPDATEASGDRAVAELVDMGFPAEKAQEALEATNGNVQAAVSWLLTQAHAESRSKTQTPVDGERLQRRPAAAVDRPSSGQRREGRSPVGGDKDPSQMASELGASLWKGANSLWKSGKKQLNKAMADLNAEGGSDPTQPKWMRDSSASRPSSVNQRRPEQVERDSGITDEAMMLDSHDTRPPPRSRRQETGSAVGTSPAGSAGTSREQSPSLPPRPAMSSPKPAWQQQAPQPRSKLSRQVVEEENAQAYVSPARRRKATPKPASPEPDLLDGASAPVVPPRAPVARQAAKTPVARAPASVPIRPPPPSRPVPTVSPVTMKSCNQHRGLGTAAFKRGDYGAAAEAYSSAISALPGNHPLVILLYTNRATTRMKTGDTKGALSDADTAIDMIGPARGSSESIDVPDEEGSGSSQKDMAQFWGKAMMRRAEALEHMERWTDAGAAWRECVQAGVGGSTSIQGRNRCDNAVGKAAKPQTGSTAAAPAARKAPVKAKAPVRPAVHRAPESFQAVNKLREANKEAERVDEEKFRLADAVDSKIEKWRKGKETNLRALLGSLDTVLWEGSGWKKVGMSELLAPNKVKIAYMKGIAKVHPDKLPTTATTEQVMISGAVFSTLNEAWDKFKAENGL